MIKKFFLKVNSNKLVNDSVWSLLGNLLNKGIGLLIGIIIAKWLGSNVYGEYSLLKNTILTISIFSTLGLGYTSTKYIAELRIDSKEKIISFIRLVNIITLIFSSFIGISLLIFSKSISIYFLKSDHLVNSLQLLSILVVLNAITTSQIGVLSGLSRFKDIAKTNSIVGIFSFFISLILTYFYQFEGALIALILCQLLNCLLNYLCIKSDINHYPFTKYKFSVKEILYYSFPITLQEAFYSLFFWAASVVLLHSSSFEQVGIYNASLQLSSIMLFIPGVLRNVILSHLAHTSNDHKEHNSIFNQMVKINIISTLIPCIIVVIISGYIESLYGDTFKGLKYVLIVSALSTLFISIGNVYNQAFMSINKNWQLLLLRIFRDGFILILFVLLSKQISNSSEALLMSYTVLISNIIFVVCLVLYYKHLSKKRYDLAL